MYLAPVTALTLVYLFKNQILFFPLPVLSNPIRMAATKELFSARPT